MSALVHGRQRSAALLLTALAAGALMTFGASPIQAARVKMPIGVEARVDAPCSLDGCGTATLKPLRGPVGTRVLVTVDHDYFDSFDSSWGLSVAFHEPGGDRLPGSGTLAPLVIVDARRATFRVPSVAPGAYEVHFSGSGDEAFGQPLVREPFMVTNARIPDTAASGDAPDSGRWAMVVLASGSVAFALALRSRRRDRRAARRGP